MSLTTSAPTPPVDALINDLLHLSHHLAAEVRREMSEAQQAKALLGAQRGGAIQNHFVEGMAREMKDEGQSLTPRDVERVLVRVETFFSQKIEEYVRLLDGEANVIAQLRSKCDAYADQVESLERRCRELEIELHSAQNHSLHTQSMVEALKREKRGRLEAEEQVHELVRRYERTVTGLEARIKSMSSATNGGGASPSKPMMEPSTPAVPSNGTMSLARDPLQYSTPSSLNKAMPTPTVVRNNMHATGSGRTAGSSGGGGAIVGAFLSDIESELEALHHRVHGQ